MGEGRGGADDGAVGRRGERRGNILYLACTFDGICEGYLVFTRKPGESYRSRFSSLSLCPRDVFRPLINSLCLFVLPNNVCYNVLSLR